MTNRQMEQEADEIRQGWTAPTTEATDRNPVETYAARVNRPLGPNDVGMLAALGHYGTSPINMTRDQRLERRDIIQHLKHPDLTGGGPDSAALDRHPDLLKLWDRRIDNDPAVREQAQQEIHERSNPRPTLDPVMTAACKRIAAKPFTPRPAPRS